MEIYIVQPKDDVDTIAARHKITVEDLIWANQIAYPYRLAVGQALLIARGAGASEIYRPGHEQREQEGRKAQAIYSFGYAYPFITPQALEDTLPYLTDIHIFSYGFTMDGRLVYPASDDTWVITEAERAGVRPVLTLTPLGADGHFNNALISTLVQDLTVQRRLIRGLIQVMEEKRYRGLDIDFEFVQKEDRILFASFVARTRTVMEVLGYEVSVALAPKTSADQQGLLYEGIDYRRLGEAADRVFLMTYEWGYTYGPPMAVAPINMVRRVVDYAVTEIPREKISLGIPNYGYDWPLPYVRGVTKAQSINNLQAIQTAVDYGVDIRFDETAQSPYLRYWQYGVQHEVWFEDQRSILAKFRLIKEYGLTGAGYWQLMSFFRANWLMMEELFTIRREPQVVG